MTRVKNVVFDAGNILIGYRWQEVLRDFGCDEETVMRVGREAFESPYWQIIDYGTDDLKWLTDRLATVYPGDAAEIRYFLGHPAEMAQPRPAVEARIPALKAAGYGIYVLSNYSEELFASHVACRPFMAQIDGLLLSAREHMLKPDDRIYRRFLEKFGLKGEECLFFDDRKENVAGAIRNGIPAICTPTEEDLLAEIDRLLAGENIR